MENSCLRNLLLKVQLIILCCLKGVETNYSAEAECKQERIVSENIIHIRKKRTNQLFCLLEIGRLFKHFPSKLSSVVAAILTYPQKP